MKLNDKSVAVSAEFGVFLNLCVTKLVVFGGGKPL